MTVLDARALNRAWTLVNDVRDGAGAALTAGYAMAFDGEPVSVIRIMLLLGIIGCVVGLKLAH